VLGLAQYIRMLRSPAVPLPEAIFHADGDAFAPTGLARGPWYPDTQHGSPMLGLLARAVENLPAERPVQVTRLTVDLLRAAPMSPVPTRTRLVRRGSSVEGIEAELFAGDELCARASALRFRINDVAISAAASGEYDAEPPPLPERAASFGWSDGGGADPEHALHHALELRPVPGFESPTAWLRMVVPFVAINPDTTLNLHRMPEGEWLCLDARATYDSHGAGTAFARLLDSRGPVGHSSQSLLVRGLEARPETWRKFAK